MGSPFPPCLRNALLSTTFHHSSHQNTNSQESSLPKNARLNALHLVQNTKPTSSLPSFPSPNILFFQQTRLSYYCLLLSTHLFLSRKSFIILFLPSSDSCFKYHLDILQVTLCHQTGFSPLLWKPEFPEQAACQRLLSANYFPAKRSPHSELLFRAAKKSARKCNCSGLARVLKREHAKYFDSLNTLESNHYWILRKRMKAVFKVTALFYISKIDVSVRNLEFFLGFRLE